MIAALGVGTLTHSTSGIVRQINEAGHIAPGAKSPRSFRTFQR